MFERDGDVFEARERWSLAVEQYIYKEGLYK